MSITKGEIKNIATIMLDADGGCPYCAGSLIETLITNYAKYEDIIKQVYKDRYGYNPEERDND